MAKKIIKGLCLGVLMGVLFLLLVYGFMLLWNVTIPDIFGVKSLDYWGAFRLLVIARILIGGFGFRWTNPMEKGLFWKERMKMKMEHMSEQERDDFKSRLAQKCRKEWE